jgi:hypothetical protein
LEKCSEGFEGKGPFVMVVADKSGSIKKPRDGLRRKISIGLLGFEKKIQSSTHGRIFLGSTGEEGD